MGKKWKFRVVGNLITLYTVCPGSSDPFFRVSDYIKWDTTSWTHGTLAIGGKLAKYLVRKYLRKIDYSREGLWIVSYLERPIHILYVLEV